MKRILVIGAAGFFGRLMVSELLRFTSAPITVAGRDESALSDLIADFQNQLGIGLNSDRMTPMKVDLSDRKSVTSALADASIAICAAGPYQNMPIHLPELCMETQVPYIDIADDRDFVIRVRALAEQHTTSPVCSGWSSMPALSAVLAQILCVRFDMIDQIHIQIAPGNKAPRSTATVASLLDSVGKQFRIWRNHAWHDVIGFDEPRTFEFPPPVGIKTGYLVDVPDHQLFPTLFNADTVEFRVGAEFQILNEMSALAAKMRRAHLVKNWAPAAPLLEKAVATIGFLGHDWGALGVEVSGTKSGQRRKAIATILAEHAGHLIPVMPAVIMAVKFLQSPESFKGLVPLADWLSKEQLDQELAARNYKLVLSS